MPRMTAGADALPRRMQRAPDLTQRQRLHALYLAASGPARHRQAMAARLGVHRHSVAAWFRASAEGGCDHARRSQRPLPPVRQRLTATALPAWQATLQAPHGFAGSHPMRGWWAEEHPGSLASARVHALVRDTLHAHPTRPRPAHAQKPPTP